jgi:hypothetical protein
MDVDLVCELVAEHVPAFVSAFGDDFYVSELAVRTAIQRHSCFSLIHLSTSFKVDVFISRGRPFDTSSMDRATLETLGGEPPLKVRIATAEDSIISKLEWYRKTNETSERQWDDVTRLIRLLGSQADLARLTHNDHCCEQLVQHRRCRSFVDGQRPATLAGCCGAYHTEPLIDVYES